MNKKKNTKNLLFIIILIILCFCNINTINASDQFKITNVEVISNQVENPPIDECFIATAAYGSLYQQPVTLLRQFRDKILLSNPIGVSFVKTYYHYSPPIADYIADNAILRFIVRILLIPLVMIALVAMNPMWLVVGLGIIIGFRVKRKVLT